MTMKYVDDFMNEKIERMAAKQPVFSKLDFSFTRWTLPKNYVYPSAIQLRTYTTPNL